MVTESCTAHGRCRLRARCDRLCHRLRCHNGGDEGDRYSHGCGNVDRNEVEARPAQLPWDHDRRVSELIYDYRTAEPRSQMILACEQQLMDVPIACSTYEVRGIAGEAEEGAEDVWVHHNNEVADRTLYPLANSRHVGAIWGSLAYSVPADTHAATAVKETAPKANAVRVEGVEADLFRHRPAFWPWGAVSFTTVAACVSAGTEYARLPRDIGADNTP